MTQTPTRACVIGNCQAEGLADWMTALTPGLAVEALSLTGASPDDPEGRARRRELLDRSDLVVMQAGPEHRARFGLPEPAALEAEGRRVIPAPWIIFRGFHPDCVHLFHRGVAIPGAAGPLHSAIAAACALEGVPRARVEGLFNAFTYAVLGYFDAHAAALSLMAEEWTTLGLDPSLWLAPRTEPFMHTVNHPVPAVLEDVARQALARAGIAATPVATPPPDRLAGGGVWPVYPEIADRLGLAQGGTAYRRPGLPDAPLSQTIDAAYAGLAAAAKEGSFDDASAPVVARARRFVRERVVGVASSGWDIASQTVRADRRL